MTGRPDRRSAKSRAGAGPPPAGERPGGPASGHWLYGIHPVVAALGNSRRVCHRLLVTEAGLSAVAAALAAATAAGLRRPPADRVDKAVLAAALPAGAVHQGVALAVDPLAEPDLETVLDHSAGLASAALVVLDQVTDPHNVGAVLRSAAAFAARAVVVTERHAPETTGVLAKSASGALDCVPLVRVVNLARALEQAKAAGFWCIGFDEEAGAVLGGGAPVAGPAVGPVAGSAGGAIVATRGSATTLPERAVLVLGAEGRGLRRLTAERCDRLLRLPTSGPIASLNVSNAAAVALYEWRRCYPEAAQQPPA